MARADVVPGDVVLVADRVVTLDAERPAAEAVLLRDGRIAAVGDRADAESWGSVARIHTFGNATIVPGLVDTHAHPVMGMRAARGVDLGDVDDLDGLKEVLRAAASTSTGWLRGWNLSPRVYAGEAVDADLLEDIAPGRPVLLKTFDFHDAFASRAALAAAGVHGPIRFPSGAEVACDVDGRPTGALHELDAVALVEGAIPQPGADEEADELLSTLDAMAAVGLTLVHSLLLLDDELDLLRRAERRRALPLRYAAAPRCAPGASSDDLAALIAAQGEHGDRWWVEGVKFFLDGTVDNGSAWLSEPDTHGESTESVWRSPSAYEQAVTVLATAGVPVYTHAIGDAAVTLALDVLGRVPAPARGTHRIEHVEVLKKEDVHRFRDLGVTASIQPAHCCISLRADGTDNWSRRLGEPRVLRGFVQPEILRAGGRVTLSSDWPIGPFDPREIMAIAELRRRPGRADQEPVKPSQALTRDDALTAYTRAPSEAAGRPEGLIRPGASACLTIFAGDLLTTDACDLPGLAVLATVVHGDVMSHIAERVA